MGTGGNRNRAKGDRAEYRVRDELLADGWYVSRAAGSLGAADFVALKRGERPQLLQVKSTASGPFSDFGPKKRDELRQIASAAGAVAMLAYVPPTPRGGKKVPTRYLDETVWI